MRADLYLFQYGHTDSREQARRLIEAGAVRLDGAVVKKPSLAIDEEAEHLVEITKPASERYVGRGGLKLEGALEAFGISPEGMTAFDIGASTGGFNTSTTAAITPIWPARATWLCSTAAAARSTMWNTPSKKISLRPA